MRLTFQNANNILHAQKMKCLQWEGLRYKKSVKFRVIHWQSAYHVVLWNPSVFYLFFSKTWIYPVYIILKPPPTLSFFPPCSQSERWRATCWWLWISSTTCHWRTCGSSGEPNCTRVVTPCPSSSTTGGTDTLAWDSWACATSQVGATATFNQIPSLCVLFLDGNKKKEIWWIGDWFLSSL